MNRSIIRARFVSIGSLLGGAVGLLLSGDSTMLLILCSAGGFLVGGALGFVLASTVHTEAAVAKMENVNRLNAAFVLTFSWILVALGLLALVVGGWNVEMALISLAFLIAALLLTFNKRMREGHGLERLFNHQDKK